MNPSPSAVNFGLLLGLSFFLGLAFEDFFANDRGSRPGGIRTFPLLALAGGLLYLFDPTNLVPFTGRTGLCCSGFGSPCSTANTLVNATRPASRMSAW